MDDNKKNNSKAFVLFLRNQGEPMEILLRLYKKGNREDHKRLLPLMKSFLEEYCGREEIDEYRVNNTIFAFLSIKKASNEAYFFENDRGEVIGFCVITKELRTNSLIIHHFYICPAFRRDEDHLGTAAFNLINSLLNPDYITLDVINGDETARKFWKSLGFIESKGPFSKVPGLPWINEYVLCINGKPGSRQRT